MVQTGSCKEREIPDGKMKLIEKKY